MKHPDWRKGKVFHPSNATSFEADIDGLPHLFTPPDTSLQWVDRLAPEWPWGVLLIQDGKAYDYGTAVMIPRSAT